MSAAACLKKIRCNYLAAAEAQSFNAEIPVLQRAVDEGFLSLREFEKCLERATRIDEQYIDAYADLRAELVLARVYASAGADAEEAAD